MRPQNRCREHAFVGASRTPYSVYIPIDRNHQHHYPERPEDPHEGFYNDIFGAYTEERSRLDCPGDRGWYTRRRRSRGVALDLDQCKPPPQVVDPLAVTCLETSWLALSTAILTAMASSSTACISLSAASLSYCIVSTLATTSTASRSLLVLEMWRS